MISRIIHNITIIILSVICALIMSEIFLKIYGKYNKLSEQKLVLSDAIYEKPKSSILKNEHPDLKIIIPNIYDSSGIRNHDAQNTEDKININAIFGDSHVENINILNKFQFTTLLNIFFKNEEYVNYGVGGYSIDQIFIRYLGFKDHDIKKVFYIFSSNDAGSIISNNLIKFEKKNYKILKPKFKFFERFLGKLNLTYFFIDTYYIVRARLYAKHTTVDINNYPKKLAEKMYYKFMAEKDSNYSEKDNLRLFNKILNSFKNEVEKNNATFQIIVLPKKEEHQAFKRMVINKENFDVINLYTMNKEIIEKYNKEIIFKNDSHFNEYGNLLIFELIKNSIRHNNKENFEINSKIEREIDQLYN